MLDVSRTQYSLQMAWRGMRQLFWKHVLKWFCQPLYKEAQTGRLLKQMLYENNDVRKQLGLVMKKPDYDRPSNTITESKESEETTGKSADKKTSGKDVKSQNRKDISEENISFEEVEEEEEKEEEEIDESGKKKNSKKTDNNNTNKKTARDTPNLDDLFE